MQRKHIGSVYRKELLETLRDRRTLALIFVVPVVIYPLMMLGGLQAFRWKQDALFEEELRVGVTATTSQAFAESLREEFKNQNLLSELVLDYDVEESIRKEHVAVAVIQSGTEVDLESGRVSVQILYDSGNVRSAEGYRRLNQVLETMADKEVSERLRGHELPEVLATPYDIATKDLASPERRGAFLFGGLLSFLLIVLAFSGAFQSAVDLTAGEKERGTMETLLVAPIGRREVVLGKYLTVLTVAVASTIVNLACMAFTFSNIFIGFSQTSTVEFSIGPRVLLGMLVTLIPLAALFSAVTVGVSSFARSYKEGQHYQIPLLLLVLFPAMLPVVPGIELTPTIAAIPVAGPSLLFRSLLLEEAGFPLIMIVFGTTFVYAYLALAWASSLYEREEILFRGASSGSGLLERPRAGFPVPSYESAMALFVICLALFGYLALNASSDASLARRVLAPQLLFLLLPLGLAWWRRHSLSRTFSLTLPTLRSWLAAPPLAVGGLIVGTAIMQLIGGWIPRPFELQKFMAALIHDAGPWGALLLIAVLPAFCEEFLCRGFLLSGLRRRVRLGAAVFLSAFLFGVLHADVARLANTTFMGVILALVVVRSGSLYPAILIHLLHNGAAVILDLSYRREFPDAGPTRWTEPMFQWLENVNQVSAVIGGVALLTIGIALLGGRRRV